MTTSKLQRKVNPIAVEIALKEKTRRSKNRSRVITFKYNPSADEDIRQDGQKFFASHGINV